ncbi:pilus assembly protein PilM [bacterium]|nr:pilus assembly protein PilM [bacterium]RQV94319.1 MAG: hypothetical protein EH221_07670 [bacterium]
MERRVGREQEVSKTIESDHVVNSSLKNSYLGLSLCTDQFCVVEIEDGVVKAIAAKELIQPFKVESFHEGAAWLSSQSEVLRHLCQKIGNQSQKVGVVINSAMVFIKKISVALGLDEEILKQQMLWEAQQCLISSLDAYSMDYQRLPFKTKEGNPIFLIILVRKSVLKGVRSLVESVGLNLQEVDIDVFSNIRTIISNYELNSDDVSVVIDIQREYLTFAFIRQKEFFLSHRVLLPSVGFITQEDILNLVQVLTKELRRLIFGHHIGREIEDLNHIFLLGSDLAQKVYKELSSSISVEIVNPFRKIHVSQNVLKTKEYNNAPEKFVAPVGIMLKEVPSLAK